jgi:mono/diheme cytochrome c family protein
MNLRFSILGCLLAAAVLISGYGFISPNDPWPVPEKYMKMPNPIKADASSISTGKSLWVKHCASCHGKTGKGDGTKAAKLKTEPGDFSLAAFKSQPDGAIFYKSLEGRKDMPNFKKKIPDQDDLWSVVNYIRSLN